MLGVNLRSPNLHAHDLTAVAFDDKLDRVAANGAVFDHRVCPLHRIQPTGKHLSAKRTLHLDFDDVIHAT